MTLSCTVTHSHDQEMRSAMNTYGWQQKKLIRITVDVLDPSGWTVTTAEFGPHEYERAYAYMVDRERNGFPATYPVRVFGDYEPGDSVWWDGSREWGERSGRGIVRRALGGADGTCYMVRRHGQSDVVVHGSRLYLSHDSRSEVCDG